MVSGDSGEPSGDPRGPSGGRWGVSGVAGGSLGRFSAVEKPMVFLLFQAIGGARGDIDSKRELLDVARRSLMGSRGVLGGPWQTPGGSRGVCGVPGGAPG